MSDLRFGELRSLLHCPPSLATFDAICGLLCEVRDPGERELMGAYAARVLEAWPRATRLIASQRLDAIGPAEAWWTTLARGVRIHRRQVQAGRLRRWLSLLGDRGRVEHLSITSSGLGDKGTAVLVGMLETRHVVELELDDNQLGPAAVTTLSSVPWPALRRLSLRGNPLGGEGAVQLMQHREAFVSLDEVALRGCRLGNRGMAALGAISGLRRLDLGRNAVRDQGAFMLAESGDAFWRELSALQLDMNILGPPALEALTAAPSMALEELNLSHNRHLSQGVAWFSVGALSRLRALKLRGCSLEDQTTAEMLHSADLGSVRVLDLGHNRLGALAMEALVDVVATGELEVLDLEGNALDARACRAWSRSPGSSRLRSLSLGSNHLEAPAIEALAALAPGLCDLELHDNPLGRRGCEVLVEFESLRRLGLEWVQLHGNQVRALAPLLLESLALGRNAIGDEGVAELVCSCSALLGGLRHLRLESCGLGDRGLACLAEAAMPRLQTLSLERNRLSRAGLRALSAAPWPELELLNLRHIDTLDADALEQLSVAGHMMSPWELAGNEAIVLTRRAGPRARDGNRDGPLLSLSER